MENWPEITRDTPLSKIQDIHKRIWQYAVDHGEKPHTIYQNDCVCCEYDNYHHRWNDRSVCYRCPLTEDICIWGGLFHRWCEETNPDKKCKLAEKIRDIKFKTEEEIEQ